VRTPLRCVKKNTKPEKLGKVARDNAFELETLAAQGVEKAAVELYRTARKATYLLTVLYQRNPNMVAAIARQKFSWPAQYSSHVGLKKRADELIANLRLGAKTPSRGLLSQPKYIFG
jgi:hypothetical protein